MITLTRLDGNRITVNADEIESFESAHETTLTLRSGRKIIVKESAEEIIALAVAYKQACHPDSAV